MKERRSFLTHLNVGFTSLAALAVGSAVTAQAKSPASAHWEPARHEKDDWLDKPSVKHRLVFDTINFTGFGEALAFAANYIRVNGSDYGLQISDLAVVIVARNRSTPFAYTDAIWAKYGSAITSFAGFEDPKTKRPPTTNVYSSDDYGNLLPSRGMSLGFLAKQGVQFAVCSVATRNLAGAIATAISGNADTINTELTTNLVTNSRMVPAGIVAVSRAQERGYTLVTT